MGSRRRKRSAHPAHPRFWGTWCAIALVRILTALPASWHPKLGRLLGRSAAPLARHRRRVVMTNLENCLPEIPATERRSLARRHFEACGIAIMETGRAWFADLAALDARLEVEGGDQFEAALASGRGVLVVGAHFVTLELVGALLARRWPLDAVYRRQRNAALEWMQSAGRRGFGRLIDHRDLRTVIARLRAGRAIWFAADQDHGARSSEFLPFFGIPAATLTSPARIARLTGARVLRLEHWRNTDQSSFTARFRTLPRPFPGSDPRADAALLNACLETAIRERPEQYLWLHRRFKTRPPGTRPFYS